MRFLSAAAAIVCLISCSGSSEEYKAETWKWENIYSNLDKMRVEFDKAIDEGDENQLLMLIENTAHRVEPHVDRLVKESSTKDPVARKYVAFGLGFAPNKNVVPVLTRLATDSIPEVRALAMMSLGMLGTRKIVSISDVSSDFERYIGDSNKEVRKAALAGLKELVRKETELSFLEKIHEALGDADPEIRNEAVRVLSAQASEKSFEQILTKVFVDMREAPIVKVNACLALKNTGKDKAVPYLILALKDENHFVCAAAHQCLMEITGQRYGASYQLWDEWYKAQTPPKDNK